MPAQSLATHSPEFRIPLIDFSDYQHSNSASQRQEIAETIVSAFKSAGFLYLSNHGIPEPLIQNVFTKSATFFSLPLSSKSALAWEDPRSGRGYVQRGRERLTQETDAAEISAARKKAPDCKESMEIGTERDKEWRNMWPREEECPGFRETMLNFFQTCHELHVSVMSAIALGLGLPERFFDDKINEQYHNLRLLSYPPIKTERLREEERARAGAHSDYGTITLLFQDSVGGLEVQNPHTGEYQPVHPIPGTIVVNVADLLSRWSNDLLRSTLHRVVAPTSSSEGLIPARQSVAYFCSPNRGQLIECLPTCFGEGREKRHASVTTEEYIVQRLKDTYGV